MIIGLHTGMRNVSLLGSLDDVLVQTTSKDLQLNVYLRETIEIY